MQLNQDCLLSLDDRLYLRARERLCQRIKLWFLLMATVVTVAGFVRFARSQEPTGKPSEVDAAEVARWGDRVVVSGEGARAGAEVLFSQAMAPPADDSDQWYVTVWGSSRDAATAAMVKAFERDGNLAIFIAAAPAASQASERPRPWAHFNVYYADDVMQKWRFESFGIPREGPFPIVTIQPPRNGAMGGVVPTTGKDGKRQTRMVVIDRIEADQLGHPADLRRRIQRSVKLWCQKLAASGFQSPKLAARGSHEAQPDGAADVTFPWGPSTPPAQPPINPQWPPGGPAADPTAATFEEIRQHCPGADAAFVLAQLAAKATLDQVKSAWSAELLKKQLAEAQAAADKILADAKAQAEKLKPVATPATPAPGLSWWESILALLGVSGGVLSIPVLVGWGIRGVLWIRSFRVSQGQTPTISDALAERLDKIDDILIALGNKVNLAP